MPEEPVSSWKTNELTNDYVLDLALFPFLRLTVGTFARKRLPLSVKGISFEAQAKDAVCLWFSASYSVWWCDMVGPLRLLGPFVQRKQSQTSCVVLLIGI